MRYTVTWTPEAEFDLASRWLSATQLERIHLTRAVGHIDRTLSQNAEQKGAMLQGLGGLRFCVAPSIPRHPLVGVVFEVKQADRIVRVLELRVIPPIA